MATTDRIRERISEFARQLREELGEVDESTGVCWLDALENQAADIGDAVSTALVEDSLTRPVAEESTCPKCGNQGRYRGTRQRQFITRRGPATIHEPEYYCPCCRKAFFPDDASDRS